MGFGRSAVTKVATNAPEERREQIIWDMKRGIKVFRLPVGSEEVKIKRHWLSQNPDGTWEPRFGYNPLDKRRSVPITVARWDPVVNRWVGSVPNWRANPIDRLINALDKADQDGKYAQEVFYLNVLDLTPVRIESDGTIHYPDDKMKYPEASGSSERRVLGKMRILAGSSGDPDGKSLYANLIRLAKSALNDDGEPLSIYDYEIRLVTTGQGKETNRSFNMGAVRDTPAEYASIPMYDFSTWPCIWPNDAVEELMAGGEYPEVVDKYNIKLYPDVVGVAAVAEEESEELFA